MTYAFVKDGRIAGFFSVSNDSIKKAMVPRSAFERAVKALPFQKRYSSMPATKIGRLGVCQTTQSAGMGTYILDFIKAWFTVANKTGCRFLVVDAYNTEKVLKFYKKNGFAFLTSKDEGDKTRIMYFDLKTFAPS